MSERRTTMRSAMVRTIPRMTRAHFPYTRLGNMSYMWHAKIAIWITEKTVEAVNGRPYFSKSTSPPQIEYEVENGATDLELLACDDDVFPVIDRTPKHTIRFHNTPRSVLACLHTALGPILKEKLMFGLPLWHSDFLVSSRQCCSHILIPSIRRQSTVGFWNRSWCPWSNITIGRIGELTPHLEGGVARTLEHESNRMTSVSDDSGSHY